MRRPAIWRKEGYRTTVLTRRDFDLTNRERLALLRASLPNIGLLAVLLTQVWLSVPFFLLMRQAENGGPAALNTLFYGTAAFMLVWELINVALLLRKKALLFFTIPTSPLSEILGPVGEPQVDVTLYLVAGIILLSLQVVRLLYAKRWKRMGGEVAPGWPSRHMVWILEVAVGLTAADLFANLALPVIFPVG